MITKISFFVLFVYREYLNYVSPDTWFIILVNSGLIFIALMIFGDSIRKIIETIKEND